MPLTKDVIISLLVNLSTNAFLRNSSRVVVTSNRLIGMTKSESALASPMVVHRRTSVRNIAMSTSVPSGEFCRNHGSTGWDSYVTVRSLRKHFASASYANGRVAVPRTVRLLR